MTGHPNVASFRWFVREWLPEALAKVIDIAEYQADETGDGSCAIRIALRGGQGDRALAYEGIAAPRADGTFVVEGRERVVWMAADRSDLSQATIRCVGEQLAEEIAPRLVPHPESADWTPELLQAWLPLDRWITEFLLTAPTSHEMARDNWLDQQAHLRRIVLPEGDVAVDPSHIGRVCPFETPEGPNCGRLLTLAVGAEVCEGRIVVRDNRPEGALGLTASMVPLLAHNDPVRQVLGVNMMREWLPLGEHEPALVRSGNEPEEEAVWQGRNLLTALVHWKGLTYEDGIVVSESAARRMTSPEPLEVGDKLSNRHGTKGVVAAILPDGAMPHLPDGRSVDLVFDFIGLHSRRNFGQVWEAALGNVAQARGEAAIAPPYGGPSPDEVRTMLRGAGLSEDGQTQLTDGRSGPPLTRPSTVGYVYWGKTEHRSRPKLVAWLDGPVARGCRQGELEFLALHTCGAYETILELFGTLSAERAGVDAVPGQLARGPISPAPAPSSAFERLRALLASAGVEVTLEGDRVRFRLASDAPAGGKLEERLRALPLGDALRPGNQVLFSARAVLAPGLDLELGEIGLPEEMTWGLFGPLVVREVGEEEAVSRGPKARQALERTMAQNLVLMNRAPTLMPTSIAAFRPVLRPGPAIRLHPLCCRQFNADFDGDQAAIFLPVTEAAQREAHGELTLEAHLGRDPGAMVSHLAPSHGLLFGLAWAEENARDALLPDWPEALALPPRRLTREWLVDALAGLLAREEPAALLPVLEQLAALGARWATASGASIHPFIGSALRLPDKPSHRYPYAWFAYCETVDSALVAQTQLDSTDLGPQVLAIRSGAGGSLSQLRQIVGPVGVTGGDPFSGAIVTGGLRDGLPPAEHQPLALAARSALQRTAWRTAGAGYGLREAMRPGGEGVIAQAMQADDPAEVFARAAERQETDPLPDPLTRLFVGLRP